MSSRNPTLPVRLYGERTGSASLPLVVHFHGGSFLEGSAKHESATAAAIAEAGAIVVSVDYPLAPEHPFPEPIERGYETLEWAWKHRATLAGRDATLWLAGEEAGANIAAALSIVARDRNAPPIRGQILIAPMLDPCVGTASLRKGTAGSTQCKWADGWRKYLGSPCDIDHPYAVPAKASRLTGVASALLVSADDDLMRDEAHAYAKRLRDAGVTAIQVVLEGPTGWPTSLTATASEPSAWPEAVRWSVQDFFSKLSRIES